MEEPLSKPPAGNPSCERLWVHLGRRIKLRREQLGLTEWTATNVACVELQTYRDYEQGERLIPADQLAALARLYNVPVFYFFEDLEKTDNDTSDMATGGQGETSYAIATNAERIAILVEDFLKLDFVRQQCLLVVARALAEDPADGAC